MRVLRDLIRHEHGDGVENLGRQTVRGPSRRGRDDDLERLGHPALPEWRSTTTCAQGTVSPASASSSAVAMRPIASGSAAMASVSCQDSKSSTDTNTPTGSPSSVTVSACRARAYLKRSRSGPRTSSSGISLMDLSMAACCQFATNLVRDSLSCGPSGTHLGPHTTATMVRGATIESRGPGGRAAGKRCPVECLADRAAEMPSPAPWARVHSPGGQCHRGRRLAGARHPGADRLDECGAGPARSKAWARERVEDADRRSPP